MRYNKFLVTLITIHFLVRKNWSSIYGITFYFGIFRRIGSYAFHVPHFVFFSQGSPHFQTQLEAVPVLSSLFPSLISLSSFTFPGAHCQIFLLFLPLASLSFLACCHHTNNKTSSQSADIYYSAIFPTLPPLS